jgi:hypothetical protein
VAAVVGIPLAAFAYLTAREAKRQASAAEKMANLAESEQRRATEPRLQIGRWPGGFAKIEITGREPLEEVVVYVENLRPILAELGSPRLNGHMGKFVHAQCEPDNDAIIGFPIEAIEPDRGITHEFKASVRVPESGSQGDFIASLFIHGGGWNAAGERLDLVEAA